VLLLMSTDGPERLLTTVGSPLPLASTCSPPPFALSLSKGQAEPVEAFGMRHDGFDRLSPNGGERGFDKLSPNGSLQTLKFAFGPTAGLRFMRRGSRQAPWSN
jgi:hypothetical protein